MSDGVAKQYITKQVYALSKKGASPAVWLKEPDWLSADDTPESLNKRAVEVER
jgi:hypothetical protein